MESSSFAMMFGKLAKFQKEDWRMRLHCRNYGIVEPLMDMRRIEDMDELEFKCWVYSIVRIGQRMPKYDTARLKNGFFINPRPFYITRQEFRPAHRLDVAKRLRKIKELYIKSNVEQLDKAVVSACSRVRQYLARGDSIDVIVHRTLHRKNQYTSFYNKLFTRIEYESIPGIKAIKKLKGGSASVQCVNQMRQEWRRMNGYSN
jgi:hypothetical protein